MGDLTHAEEIRKQLFARAFRREVTALIAELDKRTDRKHHSKVEIILDEPGWFVFTSTIKKKRRAREVLSDFLSLRNFELVIHARIYLEGSADAVGKIALATSRYLAAGTPEMFDLHLPKITVVLKGDKTKDKVYLDVVKTRKETFVASLEKTLGEHIAFQIIDHELI